MDGSAIKLPSHKTIEEDFGVHGFRPSGDSKNSMARISLMYDPLNCITVDARICPYTTSESAMCYEHLEKVKKGDLMVFDRYYASLDLMWSIKEKKADFLFRMKDNWWKVVKDFQLEELEDKGITLTTEQGKIKVRLIKFGNRVFCTSILKKKIKPQDFNALYCSRWGVEEAYKTLKNWSELENFSGKTSLAVKQDFYSKIFLMNLSAAFSHPVEEKIKKEKENYKINRVQALASTAQLPIFIFIRNITHKVFKAFDNMISKTIEMVRINRKYRRKNGPTKKHSMNYKNL